MSSVLRYFAQRNTNVTQIVPELLISGINGPGITNCSIYKLPISNAQYVGGNYYVDLSGKDASGNLLDFSGIFSSFQDASGFCSIILFTVDVDTPASAYPGLEFTVSFKNLPLGLLPLPLLTIGIVSKYALDNNAPFPYIMSPPFPPLLGGNNVSPNITLKSDSDNFDVVASGPAGWFGLPALSAILGAWANFP